jgi:prepilin signal peptidase PulO-like enzyme (type II secretory pathway)
MGQRYSMRNILIVDIIRYIILTLILVPVIFIDIKRHIIPNWLNLAGAIIAGVLIFFDLPNYRTYLFGMAFGLGFFTAIIIVSELLIKKQGMGEGDAKLMGVIGLFLGLPNTILVTFLSFVLGAVYAVFALAAKRKKAEEEIPFGPFIAMASVIAMLWGDEIINWYLTVSYI